MGQFTQKEGAGTLFKNDRKPEGSKQPDWRGDALVNGVAMEIAAWTKPGKRGEFLSLQIKPKEQREDQGDWS